MIDDDQLTLEEAFGIDTKEDTETNTEEANNHNLKGQLNILQ